MQEIHKLRAQITNIVQGNYPGLDVQFDPKLRPPNETQVRMSSPNLHVIVPHTDAYFWVDYEQTA